MQIKRLQLADFRNYTRADLAPCAGITLLYGDNAQGKTALLEAICLCCTGRSHRTARDKELIRWGASLARVAVTCAQDDGDHEIAVAIPDNARKVVKVNGAQIQRSGELMGHALGVLFAPEDLRMVKDGPAERRRFLDMQLSQIKPSYYYALQRYNRALAQRSSLLRQIAGGQTSPSMLDDWDVQLSEAGARIIEARRAFITRLDSFAQARHRALTDGREMLTVRYQTAHAVSDLDGQALAAALQAALFAARDRDIRLGVTGVGPHRDDLDIQIGGKDARAFGSQGQQRSCALSLKLAQLDVMRDESGQYPILMLDDVMSELDPARRRMLLGALTEVQTLVTCTDPSDLAGADVGQRVRVNQGSLEEG